MSDIEVVSYTRCHQCKAWDTRKEARDEADRGLCRRFAPRPEMGGMLPTVAAGGVADEIVASWPITHRDDGCAEALAP